MPLLFNLFAPKLDDESENLWEIWPLGIPGTSMSKPLSRRWESG